MTTSDSKYQVVCICGGHGFPRGTATAARITMIGRALQESGIAFRLLHCGPSPTPLNTERAGIHQGIPFQYTTITRSPKNRFLHILVYCWAVIELTFRLARLRSSSQQTAIYLYLMGGPLVVYIGIVCRLLGLPIVQELCEWWPGDPKCGRFDHWLHKRPMFEFATGVLVISKAIEERVRERRKALALDFLIHKVPALVDAEQFMSAPARAEGGRIPEFLYCGTWKKDLFFLIRALAWVRRSGYQCRLRLVLGIAEDLTVSLLEYASKQGLSTDDLILVGCVDHSVLSTLYKGAVGLLMPLWDDDRSVTRLPNKMSEYLASGRPVVTSEIGDLTDLLSDGVNAYIAKTDDERGFAQKMMAILADPIRADVIGRTGQQVCLARLDFRRHTIALASFFIGCIRHNRSTKMTGPLLENRPLMAVRNFFCRALAFLIVLSGRARAGKKRAFESGTITAIYFHKPNKALFTRSVKWLKKNRYVFITTAQLIDILHGRRKAPRGAVWLSFDDGCKELLKAVLPVAHRENVPVTFFIPSGIIEGDGLFPWMHRASGRERAAIVETGIRDSMTLSELKLAAKYPEVSIGSHTVNHAATANLSNDALRFEIQESKRQLEAWLGVPVTSFAYPVGHFDGRESSILAECGYDLAATTEASLITGSAKAFEVPRFHVGDNIPYVEAICNMTGVWHATFDPFVNMLRRGRSLLDQCWRTFRTQNAE